MKVDVGGGGGRMRGMGAGQSKMVVSVDVYSAGDPSSPALTFRIEGGPHGRGGLPASGYMTLADARDAAAQIAAAILRSR